VSIQTAAFDFKEVSFIRSGCEVDRLTAFDIWPTLWRFPPFGEILYL